MAKILRVNMSNLEVKEEGVPHDLELLGGRALTSRIVFDEVPPTCHPLSAENKLVIAPGLLSGTSAPSSGRLSVGGKSPLTGTIKEANAGGITSQLLANLGIKAIIIEGKPEAGKLYLLHLSQGGAQLMEASELARMGTYEVTTRLRQKYGEKVGVITIGPAGEMLMANAGVANNDPDGNSSRYAGRGGLGAVMGSKGVKAIVVDSPKVFEVPVKEPERFKAAAKKFTEILLSHPVTGQGLPAYGTNVLMNIISEAGALPTRNFRRGSFESAAAISGEKLAETAVARGGKATHACHPGCVMRCSNVYPTKDGEVCAPVEYETAWALGAHLENGDLDIIAKLNILCNDIGLDTIEAGGTLGIAIEAGLISFGDGEGAIRLLEEVRQGTPLGRILGQGAEFTARAFGVTRVATVKGQHMPAYDPRGAKGIGVTYATSTMGADHTAGYAIATNILKSGGYVDPLKPDGQVELSRNLQIATAAVDSTGLCLFVAFALMDNPEALPAVVEMINAQYGSALTVEDINKYGQAILAIEKEFNRRAGFTAAHDRLPSWMKTEPLPPHNTVFDVEDWEMDQVYNFTATSQS